MVDYVVVKWSAYPIVVGPVRKYEQIDGVRGVVKYEKLRICHGVIG
jgi:hypothetical protein